MKDEKSLGLVFLLGTGANSIEKHISIYYDTHKHTGISTF